VERALKAWFGGAWTQEDTEDFADDMRATLTAALVPIASAGEAGWRTVPVEPTSEMIRAGLTAIQDYDNDYDSAVVADLRAHVGWKAMLAAAPLLIPPTGPKP